LKFASAVDDEGVDGGGGYGGMAIGVDGRCRTVEDEDLLIS